MKKIYLLLLLLCLLGFEASGGTKRALVVCIGAYPPESGWNTLSSQNDKALVLATLTRCGFPVSNISLLEESKATCAAIVSALEQLAADARPGDQVYIHFSCHGQQITDQDGDEALRDPKDRLDEALVPYDAFISYNWHGYKGDRHLIDDTINALLHRIHQAVGRRGTVLLVADACHSGDVSRDDADAPLPPFRGAVDVFEQPFYGTTTKPVVNPVSWISLSACKEFQTNFEVEVNGRRYGRLTYALSRCLEPGMTAGQLCDALLVQYRQLPLPKGKSQTPWFVIPEKMKSRKLFDGR